MVKQTITEGNSVQVRTFNYDSDNMLGFTTTVNGVDYEYTAITWADNEAKTDMTAYTVTNKTTGNVDKYANNTLSHYSGTFTETEGNVTTISKYAAGKPVYVISETNVGTTLNRTIKEYDANGEESATITQTNVTKGGDSKAVIFTQNGSTYSNIVWKDTAANDWTLTGIDSGNRVDSDNKQYTKVSNGDWTLVTEKPDLPETIEDETDNATITNTYEGTTLVTRRIERTGQPTLIQTEFTYTDDTPPIINGFKQTDSTNATTYTYSNIAWSGNDVYHWNLANTTSYEKSIVINPDVVDGSTEITETYTNNVRTKREVSQQMGTQGNQITTNYNANGQISGQTVRSDSGTTYLTATRNNFVYDTEDTTLIKSFKVSGEERTLNNNQPIEGTQYEYTFSDITWKTPLTDDDLDALSLTTNMTGYTVTETNAATHTTIISVYAAGVKIKETTVVKDENNDKIVSEYIDNIAENKITQIEYDNLGRVNAELITEDSVDTSRTNFIYSTTEPAKITAFDETINGTPYLYSSISWKETPVNTEDIRAEENMSTYIKEMPSSHTAEKYEDETRGSYYGSVTRTTITDTTVTSHTRNYNAEGKLTDEVNEITEGDITNRTITKYDNDGEIDGDVIEQTNVSKSNGKAVAFTQDGAAYSGIQWAEGYPNDWDIEYIYAGTKVEGGKTLKKVGGGEWTEETGFTPGTEVTSTDDGNGKLLTRTITITDDQGNVTTLTQSNFVYDTTDTTLIKGFEESNGTDTFRYSNITWKEGHQNDWNVNNIQTSNIEKKVENNFIPWTGTFIDAVTLPLQQGTITTSEEYSEGNKVQTTETTVTVENGRTITIVRVSDANDKLTKDTSTETKGDTLIRSKETIYTYEEGKLTEENTTSYHHTAIALNSSEAETALYEALGYDVNSDRILNITDKTTYDEKERINGYTSTMVENKDTSDETTTTISRNNYGYADDAATLPNSYTETIDGNEYTYSDIHYDDDNQMITCTRYDKTKGITLQFANGYYSKDGAPYEGAVVTTDDTTNTTKTAHYEEGKLKSEFITTTGDNKTTTTLAKYKENGYQLDTKTIVEQTGNEVTSVKEQFGFEYSNDKIIEFNETVDDITYTFSEIEWNNGQMIKFFQTSTKENGGIPVLYLNGTPANQIYGGYLYKDGIVDESEQYVILGTGNTKNVIIINQDEDYDENEATVTVSYNDYKIKTYNKTNGQKLTEIRDVTINGNDYYDGTINLDFTYTDNIITSTKITLNLDGIFEDEDEEIPYTRTINLDVSELSDDLLIELALYKDTTTIPQNIQNDINILKQKEQAIVDGSYNKDTMKNLLLKAESEAQVGDLVEKSDGLYVKASDNELKKLSISFDTYMELFPLVKRFDIHQKDFNDCAVVSSVLVDSVQNPNTFSKLIQMFSEDETTGNLTVTFAGMSDYPVTFEREEDGVLILNEPEDVSLIMGYNSSFEEQISNIVNINTPILTQQIVPKGDNQFEFIYVDSNDNKYQYVIEHEHLANGYYLSNDEGNIIGEAPLANCLVVNALSDEKDIYITDADNNYYIREGQNPNYTWTLCNDEDIPDMMYVIDDKGNFYDADLDGETYTYSFYFASQTEGALGSQILEQAFAIAQFAEQTNTEIDDIDINEVMLFIDKGDVANSIFNKVFGDSGAAIDFDSKLMFINMTRENDDYSKVTYLMPIDFTSDQLTFNGTQYTKDEINSFIEKLTDEEYVFNAGDEKLMTFLNSIDFGQTFSDKERTVNKITYDDTAIKSVINNPNSVGDPELKAALLDRIKLLSSNALARYIKNKDYTDTQIPTLLSNLSDDLANNTIIIEAMFKETDDNVYTIMPHHLYNVKEINDNFVYIINPWNTGALIKVPFVTFCSLVSNISVLEAKDTSTSDTPEKIEGLLAPQAAGN